MKAKRKTTGKKVKKTGSKKVGTMGKKIMAEAKRMRKASPNKSWQKCVGDAAKKVAKRK